MLYIVLSFCLTKVVGTLFDCDINPLTTRFTALQDRLNVQVRYLKVGTSIHLINQNIQVGR